MVQAQSTLLRLFERYDLPVPENTWPGKVTRYASLREACKAGIAAEIDNGEIFDRLEKAMDRADILKVFGNLREASQERHLPAIQRCAEREARGRG